MKIGKRKYGILAVLVIIALFANIGLANAAENIISANNLTVEKGRLVGLPIKMYSPMGVAAIGVNLTFDPRVIQFVDGAPGDYNYFFGLNSRNASSGWVTINAFVILTQLTGYSTVANVAFRGVGNVNDTSSLEITTIAVGDKNGNNLPLTVLSAKVTTISLISPSDVNKDGTTDIADLVIVGQHVGENTGILYPSYDVDQNKAVNITDMEIVAQNINSGNQ